MQDSRALLREVARCTGASPNQQEVDFSESSFHARAGRGGGMSGWPPCVPTTVPVAQTDDMKSYFFFDGETAELLGKFVLPRNQTLQENCTIHNYNMIPLKKKQGKPRYVLVATQEVLIRR
jgi:hypothetical protein